MDLVTALESEDHSDVTCKGCDLTGVCAMAAVEGALVGPGEFTHGKSDVDSVVVSTLANVAWGAEAGDGPVRAV